MCVDRGGVGAEGGKRRGGSGHILPQGLLSFCPLPVSPFGCLPLWGAEYEKSHPISSTVLLSLMSPLLSPLVSPFWVSPLLGVSPSGAQSTRSASLRFAGGGTGRRLLQVTDAQILKIKLARTAGDIQEMKDKIGELKVSLGSVATVNKVKKKKKTHILAGFLFFFFFSFFPFFFLLGLQRA